MIIIEESVVETIKQEYLNKCRMNYWKTECDTNCEQ
jgi:hypothetical protein